MVYKEKIRYLFWFYLLVFISGCNARIDNTDAKQEDQDTFKNAFVQVSSEYPYYFQLSNGEPYLAIGANICWAKDIETLESYLVKLAQNGGNFARIWLSHSLFEIEKEYGKIDSTSVYNLDRLIKIAEQNNIKLKLCFEHFRIIEPESNFFNKIIYHKKTGGEFSGMDDYINTEHGRNKFMERVRYFKNRYGNHPVVFGWELWNEMNAVKAEGIEKWNEQILPEVKNYFPQNLVLQSLGSFDSEKARPIYKFINNLPYNEVAQIHRYIDEGASLEVCTAPMDVLAHDAIEELRSYNIEKPMILAEVGAVKPRHTGVSELYSVDKEGILLHDMLFAPFFSGAAGPGHSWHWDHYIDKNDLWYHFQRFANCINGIDPVKERFVPQKSKTDKLRIYTLAGKNTVMAWCRDVNSNWQNELVHGQPPETVKNADIDLASLISGSISNITTYDPWKDVWQELPGTETLTKLPDFQRSIVVLIRKN